MDDATGSTTGRDPGGLGQSRQDPPSTEKIHHPCYSKVGSPLSPRRNLQRGGTESRVFDSATTETLDSLLLPLLTRVDGCRTHISSPHHVDSLSEGLPGRVLGRSDDPKRRVDSRYGESLGRRPVQKSGIPQELNPWFVLGLENSTSGDPPHSR